MLVVAQGGALPKTYQLYKPQNSPLFLMARYTVVGVLEVRGGGVVFIIKTCIVSKKVCMCILRVLALADKDTSTSTYFFVGYGVYVEFFVAQDG